MEQSYEGRRKFYIMEAKSLYNIKKIYEIVLAEEKRWIKKKRYVSKIMVKYINYYQASKDERKEK